MVQTLGLILLPLRLQALINVLERTDLLIDIGCDHGYLGIVALKQQLTRFVWNVDVNYGPLEQAKTNFAAAQVSACAQFFLSDGFQSLPTPQADDITVVIAGLGSTTILKILANLPPYVNKLLILTHTWAYSLRLWAKDLQWSVLNEQWVHDHAHTYELIYLAKCAQPQLTYPNQQACLLGLAQFWLKSEHFGTYWKQQLNKLLKIPKMQLKTWQIEQLALIEQGLDAWTKSKSRTNNSMAT